MKTEKKRYNGWWQAIVVVAAVVLFRILYVEVYRNLESDLGITSTADILRIFDNWWTIVLTIVLDLGLVQLVSRKVSYIDNSSRRLWIDLGIVLAVSLFGLVPLYAQQLAEGSMTAHNGWEMLLSYFSLLLLNLVLVSVADLLIYFRQSQRILHEEQQQRTQAEYQYKLLRQQLNPHFLFNCLNILDYLIQNDEKQRAGDYLHKLAGVYRYVLSAEGKDVVELREEYDFAEQYTDLLKERFPEGLLVQDEIEEAELGRHIIPLTLQVLLENAIKHNIVSADQPLHVEIGTRNGQLYVSNNLQPRISSAASTGVGLRNIESLYKSLTGRGITIEKTDTHYTVRMKLM
ncbi:MAG: histidine kinase [Paludibacteraceae bacterium]|nr:histidine kinase [Paludibacteraceae bacterium]